MDSLINLSFEYNFVKHQMSVVYFMNIKFRRIANRLLSPLTRGLVSFSISYMPDNVNFTEFFGRERYMTLSYFRIIGNEKQSTARSLDVTSLPRMPRITNIRINYCGIEHIHANTFEYTGETLYLLDLNFNKLKAISIDFIAKILDTPFTSIGRKSIAFFFNPLDCSCEFYELCNFTYLSLEQPIDSLPICQNTVPHLNCDKDVQTISKRTLPDMSADTLALCKINMRISNDNLIVKTKYTLKFRLWLMQHAPVGYNPTTKCPSKQWISESVTCLILSGEPKFFNVKRFVKKSHLTIFGAVLIMANREIWPLHLQTYRPDGVKNKRNSDLVTIVNIALLSIICVDFVLGVLLLFVKISLRWRYEVGMGDANNAAPW